MFADARITVALPISAALALGLGACDLSHRMPETISTMLATRLVGDSPAAPFVAQPPSESTTTESRGNERSIRLYGPGVSRARQTRI